MGGLEDQAYLATLGLLAAVSRLPLYSQRIVREGCVERCIAEIERSPVGIGDTVGIASVRTICSNVGMEDRLSSSKLLRKLGGPQPPADAIPSYLMEDLISETEPDDEDEEEKETTIHDVGGLEPYRRPRISWGALDLPLGHAPKREAYGPMSNRIFRLKTKD